MCVHAPFPYVSYGGVMCIAGVCTNGLRTNYRWLLIRLAFRYYQVRARITSYIFHRNAIRCLGVISGVEQIINCNVCIWRVGP